MLNNKKIKLNILKSSIINHFTTIVNKLNYPILKNTKKPNVSRNILRKFLLKNYKIFSKKIIAKTLYPKQWARNKIIESTFLSRKKEGIINLYTVDNHFKFSNVPDLRQSKSRLWIRRRRRRKEKALKKLQKKSSHSQGKVMFLPEKTLLKIKLNFDIYIKAFLSFQPNHNITYISKLQKIFNQIKIKPQSRSMLFILKPIKGGYKAYSRGMIGFFPKKQGSLFWKSNLKKIGVKQIKLKRWVWVYGKKKFQFIRFLPKSIFRRKMISSTALKICKTKKKIKKRQILSFIPYFFTNTIQIRIGYKKKKFSKTKKFIHKRKKKTRLKVIFFCKILGDWILK